jgi:hypothetical protein
MFQVVQMKVTLSKFMKEKNGQGSDVSKLQELAIRKLKLGKNQSTLLFQRNN